MPLSVRRLLASTINVLITVILSRPLVACGANHETAVIAVFLVYNLVCEMALGRCLGGTVAGIHWVNAPSLLRRVGFCFLYTLAFVPYVVFPLWQIVPNVTVQWLWGHYVGGTIHSWLAGVQST